MQDMNLICVKWINVSLVAVVTNVAANIIGIRDTKMMIETVTTARMMIKVVASSFTEICLF
jgi:hypothetical protein